MSTNIEIEDFYPYSYQPKVRHGDASSPHPIIEPILANGLERHKEFFEKFKEFSDDLLKISRDYNPERPGEPCWINGFLPGLDSVTLYGMVAVQKPKIYCEIGSGNPTKFVAAAKKSYSPNTRIISIDPAPRAEVDELCNEIIRLPLQE